MRAFGNFRKKVYMRLIRARVAARKTFAQRLLIAAYGWRESFRAKNSELFTIDRVREDWRNQNGTGVVFLSYYDLVTASERISRTVPMCDVVVGIPRSGLLPATIIATRLGLPLSTVDLFPEVVWQSGAFRSKLKNTRNILLVDDSISTGAALKAAIDTLREKNQDIQIITCALFVTDIAKHAVDVYYEIVHPPRLFEWNLLHAKRGTLAVDMDGVLCEDVAPGLSSQEDLYKAWIENPRPYLIPHFKIDYIITNRLDTYRPQTEAWLQLHGVEYGELVMARSKEDTYGSKHKIDAVRARCPDIVWESSYDDSLRVWKHTKIPTLCFDRMIMFPQFVSPEA
jgi:hypoxanthine phosphoribosyltransferase